MPTNFHEEYKIPFRDYHFKFHDSIDEKIIAVNEEMKEALEAVQLPHVILTNASRRWAQRTISHLGLDRWFTDDHIIAQEDAGFQPKSSGYKGFEIAIDKLGMPEQNILMVDDLARNLRIPKEMGMQTALVHHGAQHDELPDFVDIAFSDTIALMRSF